MCSCSVVPDLFLTTFWMYLCCLQCSTVSGVSDSIIKDEEWGGRFVPRCGRCWVVFVVVVDAIVLVILQFKTQFFRTQFVLLLWKNVKSLFSTFAHIETSLCTYILIFIRLHREKRYCKQNWFEWTDLYILLLLGIWKLVPSGRQPG